MLEQRQLDQQRVNNLRARGESSSKPSSRAASPDLRGPSRRGQSSSASSASAAGVLPQPERSSWADVVDSPLTRSMHRLFENVDSRFTKAPLSALIQRLLNLSDEDGEAVFHAALALLAALGINQNYLTMEHLMRYSERYPPATEVLISALATALGTAHNNAPVDFTWPAAEDSPPPCRAISVPAASSAWLYSRQRWRQLERWSFNDAPYLLGTPLVALSASRPLQLRLHPRVERVTGPQNRVFQESTVFG